MEEKRRRIWTAILIIVPVMLVFCTIWRGQPPEMDLARIAPEEIEEIYCSGYTGGENGAFSYYIPEEEREEFGELLNRVRLGRQVREERALTTGAVKYYTLYFEDGRSLEISPGIYFKVGGRYYEFENQDELREEFLRF